MVPEKRNNTTRISPANAAWKSKPTRHFDTDDLVFHKGEWGYWEFDEDDRPYFISVDDEEGTHPNDQGDAGDKGSFFN